MGICLDTEQNNDEVETEGGSRSHRDSWAGRATPPAAAFPMQNTSHVKFEPPAQPVIFVLGGPGSGKVTHCDNLTQERHGLVHINMTDLLQQYAIGNDMQDFGTLSSKTVTEVLMLEMKMAPTAKAYLVSGYPRSMRDVAEYSDKIQTLSGVIVVSWRQRVLERQIEYGARLGHVVLSLARMELANFYRHVMPVADYFDQTNMLVAVNGERNPEEVYKDFRAAVLQILGAVDEQNLNGVNGVGMVGAGGIPGEIVGVERAPNKIVDMPVPIVTIVPQRVITPKSEIVRVRGASTVTPIVWVVGGPGSNKASLCQQALNQKHGWIHYSLGQRLRTLADSGGGPTSDGALARAAVTVGELAPKELVTRLVQSAVSDASRSGHGLVLDGYPRDLEQMEQFEKEWYGEVRMVLVDCSKLQLGRGRRDDGVAAFRRRLELFREKTLPALRQLDQQHRLAIVDGDTDTTEVQDEFARILNEEMEKAEAIVAMPQYKNTGNAAETTVAVGSTMQQFAHAMSRMGNGFTNGTLRNGSVANGNLPNGTMGNGFLTTGINKVKPFVDTAPKISTVSQMTHDEVRRLYDQSSGDITMNTHM